MGRHRTKNKQTIELFISKERNMFVAERFIAGLASIHGKHPVSTDGGTWYPQAGRFLRKSIIERTVQHIKEGQNVLMITLLATERKVAISSISKTGLAYLRQCVTRRC